MASVTRTTCPYCGVGCGVVARREADGTVSVAGDPDHPANRGRLCVKGAALAETLGLEGRLLRPHIGDRAVGWDEALEAVAQGFRRVIDEHGPDAVAFYGSGQLLTEDYYVANKLMKGFIGSGNMDTNSRLCMSSSVAGHIRAFGTDSVPGCYEDLELADLVVLVGSNTAWCHPVVYRRLMAAKERNPALRIVAVDPRRTATAEGADLHLAIRPGSDTILFNGLLAALDEAGATDAAFVAAHTGGVAEALRAAHASCPSLQATADACGVEVGDLKAFYSLFARTERVVTVYSQGVNQSSCGTDKVNAIINCHLFTGRIGKPGMGPLSLTGQPNAMGGREVGGLANQLAAHMPFDAEHVAKLGRFWNAPAMTSKPGLKAVELFDAIDRGEVKAVWIMATNPAVSLPETDKVRRALAKCGLVVLSDCMAATDTAHFAHIRLPALTWGEKDGTVTNSERCISRQRAFLDPPGEAKPDWWILCEIAKRLGFGEAFAYDGPAAIFREHARLSVLDNDGGRDFDIGGYAALSDGEYDRLSPAQWPVAVAGGQGTPRLFTDGHFFTPDRRARFVAVTPRPVAHPPSADFPLVLNSGRVRDQWHTMTRTGKSPRLAAHRPEPFVALHPSQGIAEGAIVRVTSPAGGLLARALLDDGLKPGDIFVPMHWNDQYAAQAVAGAAILAATDPVSGQPELKHSPVRVEEVPMAWHGLLLSRESQPLPPDLYWSRSAGRGFHAYRIAGAVREDFPAWARRLLGEEGEWLDYQDRRRGLYRAAVLRGGRLEACLFLFPTPDFPAQDWLGGLFGAGLADADRAALLAGGPVEGGAPAGRTVCACFNVGLDSILAAITGQGLTTAAEIGQALKAGTNCGSCIPELKAILQMVREKTAA